MKRYSLFAVIALLFCSCLAFADSIDDQINAAQQSLNDHVQKRETMTKQWPTFEQRKSDIEFAYAAYVKQAPIVKQEIDEIDRKQAVIDSRYQELVPIKDRLVADGNAHNSRSCTEQCDQNGRCDGTCAWYENEKAALEQRQAQLNAQISEVNAVNQENDGQRQTVKKSAEELDTIMDTVSQQTLQWTADVKQFKSDWDDNEGQITLLTQTIERLKEIKTKLDDCTRSIPAECEAPNTPYWVGQCATMHATCGRIFDGNR